MYDAKPVLMLLLLSSLGVLWLVLDWVSASPRTRAHRVERIAIEEDAATLAPLTLVAQAHWLVQHRLGRLQGLSLLLAVALLAGVGEGTAQRRRDRLAGVRVRSWTLGLVAASLVPGLVGGLLLWPRPWSLLLVAGVGTAWTGLAAYLMTSGAPHVA